MKRVFAIIFLILVMTVSHSFAQMGHGMMRGGHMGEGGHMMDNQGIVGDQRMRGLDDIFTRKQGSQEEITMQHRHMMSSMMGMTQDMAIMMRQMSLIMVDITDTDRKASRDKLHRVSNLMKTMSAEMNRISDMIGKGTTSDEEMSSIQNRMNQIQQEMWELK